MAKFAGDENPSDPADARMAAVDTYAAALQAVEVVRSLRVLQENKMACVRCNEEHTCHFAYDLYNFDTEPQIDCLAAK